MHNLEEERVPARCLASFRHSSTSKAPTSVPVRLTDLFTNKALQTSSRSAPAGGSFLARPIFDPVQLVDTMKKVFVSGCYDIIHAGHIQFFSERALGDHLTVCFASDLVLWNHKERRSSLPQEHKLALLRNLIMVDHAVIGENESHGLDFQDHFRRIKPDILAVTEDDQYADLKKALCAEIGASYIRLQDTTAIPAGLLIGHCSMDTSTRRVSLTG